MKESFLLYKSFYEPIKGLSLEEKGILLDAIFQYQIDGTEPTNKSIIMPFMFFKNQFRLDGIKYNKIVDRNRINGSKGGRPKKPSGLIDNPKNPSKPKKADKDNVNEKDNEKDNENINKIYSLYPSKCPVKNSGTGKTKNNKDKIKQLLQIYSVKELELIINSYIEDCKKSDRYIKNFSTFLNNLPEPEPEKIKVKKEFITYYRQGIADRTCSIDEWEGIQNMYGPQITGFKKTIKEVAV